MPRKVFVTSLGILSAIGGDTGTNLQSLYQSKSGIGRILNLKTSLADEFPAAEIKLTNDDIIDLLRLSLNKFYTRTALIGLYASNETINKNNFDRNSNLRTGLISATTVGGMDKTEKYFNNSNSEPIYLTTHDCGDSTEKIADYHGINHYISTISTACSSSANSIMTAARLIRNNRIDRALAGGTDALSMFTLNGFNTLMILDKTPCKPFDENRSGLTIGEGAAYLMLESEESIEETQNTVLCELTGWANANDAFHQTASSPEGEGAFLSMSKALQFSGLRKEDIHYINAHGTGTLNNDLSEGKAIERIFNEKVPPISSTKSFTGHTLGAAGAIEAVFSVLAIQNNLVFPNLNFSNKMKELNFIPEKEIKKNLKIDNVLSNSFGFGGNNSTLIFSRCSS